MIALDTNVMIRYLTQDDPAQAKKANHLIKKAIDDGETLWICQITLCEVVWVLERAYDLSKSALIDVLQSLLQTRQIHVEGDDVAWQSLRDYERCSSAGFVDCLIGRQNARQECPFTYTFDAKAAKQLETFKLLT
jgi:predicted nucleic-acid-binding protein